MFIIIPRRLPVILAGSAPKGSGPIEDKQGVRPGQGWAQGEHLRTPVVSLSACRLNLASVQRDSEAYFVLAITVRRDLTSHGKRELRRLIDDMGQPSD